MWKFWNDFTTNELNAIAKDEAIAILPVGATEQHGRHLPLSTDNDILTALLTRARSALEAKPALTVIELPLLPFGYSVEHSGFSGTISLRPQIAISVIADVVSGIAASGLRRLLLLTAHGGNMAIFDIAAREARKKHSMLSAYAHWQSLADAGMTAAEFAKIDDIHAGGVETTIMAAINTGKIRQIPATKANKDQTSANGCDNDLWWYNNEFVGIGGKKAKLGWLAEDLSLARTDKTTNQGVAGTATISNESNFGASILANAATNLIQVVRVMAEAPLPAKN